MVKATTVKMNSTQATIYNSLHDSDPTIAQDYAAKLAKSMRQTKDTIASGILRQRFGFNPNNREAYMMPLSQLVTLWQAKYGDKWVVREGVLEPETFFEDAYWRLRTNGLLEEAQDGWFRLKEDA